MNTQNAVITGDFGREAHLAEHEATVTAKSLIAAAETLSMKIIERYSTKGDDFLKITHNNIKGNSGTGFYYYINRGRVWNGDLDSYVAANRASALRFAEDVAAGLLNVIEESAQADLPAQKKGLGTLETAIKAM